MSARPDSTPAPAPRVAVIGAGRVGCSLAGLVALGGADVTGFASRTRASAEEAAARAGGRVFADAAEAAASADVILVTTPDGALAGVWDGLAAAARAGALDLCGRVVCHCSGALTAEEVFPGATELGAHACSAHPLFAVSSKDAAAELTRCLFTLEGDEAGAGTVEALLGRAGCRTVRIAGADKVRYHAAAVMASNLVSALFAEAEEQLERCGFTERDAHDALAPLFLGNARHVAEVGVAASLTGPAQRGDTATIERHLSCLDGDDREIYRLLTNVLYRVVADSRGGA